MTDIKYTPDAQAIADEYPGWEAWTGLIGGQWHARLKGSEPVVMVHDDSPAGIRDQIREYASRNRQGVIHPEGPGHSGPGPSGCA
jgi:hypothetical protein